MAYYKYLKIHSKGTSLQVPHQGPMEKDAHHQGLLHVSFRKPSKAAPLPGSPLRAPIERDAASPKHTFTRLSKARERSPLPGSPTGHPWKEMPIPRAFIHSIHSYTGKEIQSPSTEPHADGRPTYSGVRPDSPRGSFWTLPLTTPVPCSLRHDTFHLGLGRPEPRQPACVMVTLYRISTPHLLPLPTWPRVETARMCQGSPIRAPPSHLLVCIRVAPLRAPLPHPLQSPHNPKVQMRGWIYGRGFHRLYISWFLATWGDWLTWLCILLHSNCRTTDSTPAHDVYHFYSQTCHGLLIWRHHVISFHAVVLFVCHHQS
jgi:hypothetical protein